MNLKDISKYSQKIPFNVSMRLNQCTNLNCVKTTLNSLISYMSSNKGNKCYMPYYNLSIEIIKKYNDLQPNNPKERSDTSV